MSKETLQLDRVVIRFAGDSGDGMQLTGDRFTSETAQLGNDISTLPNFPAEIRAPAGTLPGVSSFQVHFADFDILTPGDAPNVLVAGRCFSATHDAHASVRSMAQCMAMGQAAGTAAAMSIGASADPRDVPAAALRERLRAAGAIVDAAGVPA